MLGLLNHWMKICFTSFLNENIPILTIEEAVLQGGFGSAVLEFAHDHGFYQC